MGDLDIGDDSEGPKPTKIRNIESTGSTNSTDNPNPTKQLFKDLRVKVERLSSDGHSDVPPTQDGAEDNERSSMRNAKSEERQVPCLPVAEDEPAREISSTCPQGLKKEGSQEDMVTSSSQEPRTKCVFVQTDQIQAETVPAKV